MRRAQRLRRKRARLIRTRRVLIATPVVVLFVFSFFVRSADSSSNFRLNQRWLIEQLKSRIEESTPSPAPLAVAPGAPEAPRSLERFREVREVVRRGDTFTAILSRAEGVDPEDARWWIITSRKFPELARVRPERVFTFLLDEDSGRLAGLQYEISSTEILEIRLEDDDLVGYVDTLPTMTEVHVAAGRIETSLYRAAVEGGVPDAVVSSFADIFGWEIDFRRDVRRGDEFQVAYEVVRDGSGDVVRGGRILAARFTSKRGTLNAVYYDDGDGDGNYYGEDGTSIGLGFLRYPVEFTRISSQFTKSRFHPVLGVRRPHLGVDFAAPMGTPVRSIGSGTVRVAGWNGGNGRFVKIDHGRGFASSYSHLRAIRSGIRPGARVSKGQVIGTVGASGLATGPHLHFAIYRNGVYVNPMGIRLPEGPRLTAERMPEFERVRDALLDQLETAGTEASSRMVRLASAGSVR